MAAPGSGSRLGAVRWPCGFRYKAQPWLAGLRVCNHDPKSFPSPCAFSRECSRSRALSSLLHAPQGLRHPAVPIRPRCRDGARPGLGTGMATGRGSTRGAALGWEENEDKDGSGGLTRSLRGGCTRLQPVSTGAEKVAMPGSPVWALPGPPRPTSLPAQVSVVRFREEKKASESKVPCQRDKIVSSCGLSLAGEPAQRTGLAGRPEVSQELASGAPQSKLRSRAAAPGAGADPDPRYLPLLIMQRALPPPLALYRSSPSSHSALGNLRGRA